MKIYAHNSVEFYNKCPAAGFLFFFFLKRINEKKNSICNNISKFLVLDETLNDCYLNAVEIQHLYTAFPSKVDG